MEVDNIFKNLLVAATVKVRMRAVNEIGEAPFGDEVQVVVT